MCRICSRMEPESERSYSRSHSYIFLQVSICHRLHRSSHLALTWRAMMLSVFVS
jgi:hypothetical protein